MTNIDRWTALECAAALVLAFAFQQSARSQDNLAATSANTAAVEGQTANGNVPRIIRFSGVAQDETHNPTTGMVEITFSLYKDQQGGSPLWVETQNVQADANGHYTALLGSASAEGMPLELFSSGEAHWLGVQIEGQPEHARVLLVSVPYALKAHEAETLSGRSISDFVLLNKTGSSSSSAADTPVGSNGTSSSSSPLPGNYGPTNFAGANATQIVSVTQKGAGLGLSATSNGTGVSGVSKAATGSSSGVYGQSASTTGSGVSGNATAVSGYANGVNGQSASTSGAGVSGNATAVSGYANGVYGQSASTMGSGVVGIATSTSNSTVGVYGSGNGTGVYGNSANGVGLGGMGATLGVWGDSATINGTGVAAYSDATSGYGNGVYGQSASTSGIGVSGNATATTGNAYGIFGQTATTGFGAGVIGVTTATTGNAFGVFGQSIGTSGNGVFGYASAPSGSTIGVAGVVESPTGTAGRFVASAGSGLILQGVSGSSGTNVVFTVDANGNLDISGNLTVAGSKSARVKLQDGREVALYAVESPENWFEDFGTAQLQAGTTRISFEAEFLQTVDTAADYHVFLTPNGDCRGLYIARKTRGGFEVRELGGGKSSLAFDYRIVARRRGFENVASGCASASGSKKHAGQSRKPAIGEAYGGDTTASARPSCPAAPCCTGALTTWRGRRW